MIDIPNIMQAAERLRRLKSGESTKSVYGEAFEGAEWGSGIKQMHDQQVLADAFLSIRPKGERPVAIAWDSMVRSDPKSCWTIHKGTPREWKSYIVAGSDVPAYPTEAAARLALHWQKFDEIVAMAEAGQ